jgi:hypothetical protein
MIAGSGSTCLIPALRRLKHKDRMFKVKCGLHRETLVPKTEQNQKVLHMRYTVISKVLNI